MKTQLIALLARSNNSDLHVLVNWFYDVYIDHCRILKTVRQLRKQEKKLPTDLITKGLQSHSTVICLMNELLSFVFALPAVVNASALGVRHARKKYSNGILKGSNKLQLCLDICKALQKGG